MARVPSVIGPEARRTGGGGARLTAPQVAIPTAQINLDRIVTPQVRAPRAQTPTYSTSMEPGVTAGMAAVTAQQTGRVARDLVGAGDDLGRISMDVQTQFNAMVADKAVSDAKQVALRLVDNTPDTAKVNGLPIGFRNIKGYDALNRPADASGKRQPLADEYAATFDKQVEAISKNLTNDAQRMAFRAQAATVREGLYAQATQHESTEFRNFNLSVQEGVIATEQDVMARNYTNPDQMKASRTRIEAAVSSQALALGRSSEWAKAESKKIVSAGYATALKLALEDNNIAFADAALRAWGPDMTADDVLGVKGVVTKEMDAKIAVTAAAEVVAKVGPKLEPTEISRVRSITRQAESRGREFNPDGSRVTSPKGARGVMQVMPHTAAKPGFGIKPSNGTPQDDARLGDEYMDAMIGRYGGDLGMAWAAYNAGPGRVDDALKQGRAENKNWLTLLPKETREYVTNNLAAYGAGLGRPPRPSKADLYAELDKRPELVASPTRMAAARTEVDRRWSALEDDEKTRNEDIISRAYQGVTANGGDYNALPVALKAAIPADKIDSVQAYAKGVAENKSQPTDMATYYRLSNDDYLRSLSDQQFWGFRPQLSGDDFQKLSAHRQELRSDKSAQGPESLNTAAMNAALNDRLMSLSLDPTPKEGTADSARIGAMRRYVREQTLLAQRASGKKLTDAEQTELVDRIFTRSLRFTGSGVFGGGKSTERMMTMSASDIPADDRNKIKAQFKARGNTKPTDADILGAYWRMHPIASR